MADLILVKPALWRADDDASEITLLRSQAAVAARSSAVRQMLVTRRSVACFRDCVGDVVIAGETIQVFVDYPRVKRRELSKVGTQCNLADAFWLRNFNSVEEIASISFEVGTIVRRV